MKELLEVPGLGAIISPHPDVLEIRHQVELLIQAVVQKMNETDPTLQLTIEIGGSVREGTKIGLPDEFDTYLCIEGLHSECQVVREGYTGEVTLKLKSRHDTQVWSTYVKDGELDATTLHLHIHGLLYEALYKIFTTSNKYPFYWKPYGLGEIHLEYMGKRYNGMAIKVDVSPCI